MNDTDKPNFLMMVGAIFMMLGLIGVVFFKNHLIGLGIIIVAYIMIRKSRMKPGNH